MKRTWKCPKCAGSRVGYLESLPDGAAGGASTDRRLAMTTTGRLLGMTIQDRVGSIEAFVCTECGYFEEYVRDPQALDWSSVTGFRWCVPSGQR